jgi:hypothetical protein
MTVSDLPCQSLLAAGRIGYELELIENRTDPTGSRINGVRIRDKRASTVALGAPYAAKQLILYTL